MTDTVDTDTAGSVDSALVALSEACEGEVLTPGEPGYDGACAAWNLAWTQRPAVVVRVASENDVVLAVQYAVSAGLAVAVQSTGHGVTVPADPECVLIVMGALNTVTVDAAAATATFGGGATWAPVLAAAQQHSLAPLVGSSPNTGAVSYSLGGGIGWLTRKYGLALDAVRSLRVVLADGRVVTASEAEEADLFWAMCGTGGGSLGVVVEITVGLVPVSEVYAGSLFYPVEDARDVFERYRDWSARNPEGLTSAFNITAFPPIDLVPEPLRGKAFAIVRGCYTGDELSVGEALVNGWRDWRSPAIDMWGHLPYSRSAEISQDPVDPMPANSSGRWVSELSDELLEVMVDTVLGEPHPSPVLFVEARHTGGAMSTPNDAVSFAARGAEFCVEIIGLLADANADEELDRRMQAAWKRLEFSLTTLPGYLNFVEGKERVTVARTAFPEPVRSRLASIAHHYDPDRVFRYALPLQTWHP